MYMYLCSHLWIISYIKKVTKLDIWFLSTRYSSNSTLKSEFFHKLDRHSINILVRFYFTYCCVFSFSVYLKWWCILMYCLDKNVRVIFFLFFIKRNVVVRCYLMELLNDIAVDGTDVISLFLLVFQSSNWAVSGCFLVFVDLIKEEWNNGI